MRVLLLLVPAFAQLVVTQSSEEEDALAPQTLLATEAAEGQAPEGLQSPTLCDPHVKQHSGYLKASGSNEYFFWMFESRSKPSTDPVIFWLNGGPGCSSILGLFSEHGPCKVKGNVAPRTTINPDSWNTNANVVYVDQPAQTGFSKGAGLATNEDMVATGMIAFIQSFYAALPQYKTNDFYLFGESYAGHYVPAIAHAIWADQKSPFKVPLKGIGVGNGLVDPLEQYKWYAKMALDGGKDMGGSYAGPGVVTGKVAQGVMKAAIPPCEKQIALCNNGTLGACAKAYSICNYGEQIPYRTTGMNPYDMRIKCETGNLCYDFTPVDVYLNQAAVQSALGVKKMWTECNMYVNVMFKGDFMRDYQQKLPDLLGAGIRVLIYAGDCDFICNWIGNKKWALGLPWKHQADFAAAKDAPWMVGGKQAGRMRTAAGFSFLQVYQAGHMVPMDQPEAALQMVKEFTMPKEINEIYV